MFKKILCTSVFCFGCTLVLAQEGSDLTSVSKITAGMTSLSFNYQTPVASEFALDSKLGIGASARVEGNQITLNYLQPAVFISSELRYLYNYHKRKDLGKNTMYNSVSFLGIKTNYQFKSLSKKNDFYNSGNTLSLAGIWGLQRSLNRSFLFNFHLGVGWVNDFNTNSSNFYPEIGLGFSYVLNKK